MTRRDDFFALGGHSLLAMRLLARINAAFTVDVALHEMFEHRTIAELADAIGRAPRRAEPAIAAVPASEAPNGAVAALSDAEIDALLNGYLTEAGDTNMTERPSD